MAVYEVLEKASACMKKDFSFHSVPSQGSIPSLLRVLSRRVLDSFRKESEITGTRNTPKSHSENLPKP